MSVRTDDVPALPVSPDAVREAAAAVASAADGLETSVETVFLRWGSLPGAYNAPESDDLTSAMLLLRPAAAEIATGCRAMSTVLHTYAERLDTASRTRGDLVSDVETFVTAAPFVALSPAQLEAEPLLGIERTTPANDALLRRCNDLAKTYDEAAAECAAALAAIDAPTSLLADTEHTDADTPAPVPMSDSVEQDVLRTLSDAGGANAEHILNDHPELAQLLREHPPSPEVVAQWWQSRPRPP